MPSLEAVVPLLPPLQYQLNALTTIDSFIACAHATEPVVDIFTDDSKHKGDLLTLLRRIRLNDPTITLRHGRLPDDRGDCMAAAMGFLRYPDNAEITLMVADTNGDLITLSIPPDALNQPGSEPTSNEPPITPVRRGLINKTHGFVRLASEQIVALGAHAQLISSDSVNLISMRATDLTTGAIALCALEWPGVIRAAQAGSDETLVMWITSNGQLRLGFIDRDPHRCRTAATATGFAVEQ